MEAKTKRSVVRLFDFVTTDDEEAFFANAVRSFTSKNPEVEQFLRQHAVQAMRLCTAATYLVVSGERNAFDILGYFAIATKILTLKKTALSKTEARILGRFSNLDEKTDSYKLPAILIAQFSRNFHTQSSSIPGAELMSIAQKKIRDILRSTSGKTVFLECEQDEKLLRFYADNGFQPLGSTVRTKNSKALSQLYMIL